MAFFDYIDYLWYTGESHPQTPTHEILDSAKRRISVRYAESLASKGGTDGKQMAEKILDQVKFDTAHLDNLKRSAGSLSYEVAKQHGKGIDVVHRLYSDKIRAAWDEPELTDAELADALLSHALEQAKGKYGFLDVPDGLKYQVTIGSGK